MYAVVNCTRQRGLVVQQARGWGARMYVLCDGHRFRVLMQLREGLGWPTSQP